jgi:transposase, IS5 family
LLEQEFLAGKKPTGRPGLDLWQVLVLGVVRLGLDCDYARLEHLANYDVLVRQILGLNPVQAPHERPFHSQTLTKTLRRVDSEVLGQINAILAAAGHAVFKTKRRRRPHAGRAKGPKTSGCDKLA